MLPYIPCPMLAKDPTLANMLNHVVPCGGHNLMAILMVILIVLLIGLPLDKLIKFHI